MPTTSSWPWTPWKSSRPQRPSPNSTRSPSRRRPPTGRTPTSWAACSSRNWPPDAQHRHDDALRRASWSKRLADFDFSFQPSIDRTLVEELATGRFLADGRNVVFLGPPGVGKTHLADRLRPGLRRGRDTGLFLSALELARRMNTAFAQNRLPALPQDAHDPETPDHRRGVGYLGLDAHQASMLFQVICSRYEKQVATIVTSNKGLR